MKLKKNQYVIIAVVALVVIVLLQASIFQQGTIISVSQIYVEPQGRAIGDEWTGSFWNIVAAVTTNDNLAGVVLPKDQTDEITVEGVLETLHTGAKIEIRIDPGQPYLIRDLQEKTVKVTPELGATVEGPYPAVNWREDNGFGSASALWLDYYDWGENQWRIYTPYTVTILKDGQQVGQKTLNMEGTNPIQTVDTGEGSVRIENLGILQGQYMSPNTPSQICIVKGHPNMYSLSQITNYIGYDQGAIYDTIPLGGYQNVVKIRTGTSQAYSTYWYSGYYRWKDNKHPAFVPPTNVDNVYGGWQQATPSGYQVAKPVTPVIGSSDKSSLPSEKRNFMSLLEYIESKGVANLANTMFSQYSKVELVTDPENGYQTAMKLSIPWNAYGTPIVNFRVPTELADTWVDRPVVSDVSLSAVWERTGTDTSDLSGSARIAITATQNAEFLDSEQSGGVNLQVEMDNQKIGVYPLSQTVSLKSGESKTVYVEAKNLGVAERADKQPIKITAYDTYLGEETDSVTVYANLLPTLYQDTTTLDILAVEKQPPSVRVDASKPITGLQIQVIYPPSGGAEQTLTGYTDANGKLVLDLTYEAGGGYEGSVAIQSVETEKYRSAYRTLDVVGGLNEVVLEVELKGEDYPEPTFDWWWLLIIAVAAVAVTALVMGRKKKHKRSKPKKRKVSVPKVPKVGGKRGVIFF